MTPERWRLIEQICHEALAREPAERAAYLDEACAGDADLRRDVESLVSQQSAAEGFLEKPVLEPGSRLDRYEVIAHLASGGMGDVYEARDTRLGRVVAIKVLSGLAADPERRGRFEQEAHAASALNHPHICTLHDIGAVGDLLFLVMERLDGQTLSERLRDGPLPLAQALDYALQIADALAAAHAHGIVHRDLKPANIMLTATGAKLLDFGLAKLKPASAGIGATAGYRDHTTTPGMVFGTLPYMAPEQLDGKATDARTDLFAFGCVVYEMIAGRRAFDGDSDASIITGVKASQPPPVSSLRPGIPSGVERVVQECLQKDPHDRPESARDVADELRRVASDGHSPSASVWIRRWSVVVLAFVAIAAMLVRVAGRLKSAPAAETAPAPMRILPLTTLPGYEFAPALSPDGSMVAFAWDEGKPGQLSLYVQTIGSAEARRVDGPLDWIGVMAWSPDARRIAFLTRHPDGTRRIRVTSLVDNTSQLLSDVPVVRGGLDWSPDGLTIAALQAPAVGEKAPDGSARPLDDTDNAGIVLIPVDGNTPHHLTRRTPPVRDADPHFSPDGRSVAFASCANACTVSVVALDGLEPRGTPRPLTPLVARVSRVAWSRDGRTILFDSRSAIGLFSLWRVPVNGSRPLERVEEAGYIGHAPSTARHSDRLVFDRVLDDWDIYRIESGHDAQPWAASSLVDIEPQYAPDGRRVVFSSTRTGTAEEIWIAAADGTAARQLTHGPNSHQRSAIWSPDSTRVAFDSQSGDGRWHVWVIDAEGGPARQITTGPEGEDVAGWSPDGTEIYFMTQRAGGTILWRTPATGMGQRQIVDREAGYIAGISIDGNVVFQTKLDQSPLMIKPITGGPGRELAACALAYAEQPQGFYYVGCPTQPGADPDVHFIPRPSGEDRIVCHLKNWALESWFTVSPDGKSMLYEQQVRRGSDVMLIENFR